MKVILTLEDCNEIILAYINKHLSYATLNTVSWEHRYEYQSDSPDFAVITYEAKTNKGEGNE